MACAATVAAKARTPETRKVMRAKPKIDIGCIINGFGIGIACRSISRGTGKLMGATAGRSGLWRQPASCGERRGRDLGPVRKGLCARGAVFIGRELIARRVEEIGNLIVNGQKLLDLSRRFESLHDSFSPSCR